MKKNCWRRVNRAVEVDSIWTVQGHAFEMSKMQNILFRKVLRTKKFILFQQKILNKFQKSILILQTCLRIVLDERIQIWILLGVIDNKWKHRILHRVFVENRMRFWRIAFYFESNQGPFHVEFLIWYDLSRFLVILLVVYFNLWIERLW
jgi:hypothetical protein